MRRPRTALAVVVVATVLLAGCLGGGAPGGADDGSVTTPTATATATSTTTATDDGSAAERIRDEAVAAVEAVDTYAFEGRLDQEYREVSTQTATVNTTGWVDRANRRLQVNQTQSSAGRTYAVETYVVDGTVWSHSGFYTQDYGTEWIRTTPANFSGYWETVDTLARQRAILEAANVSLAGTETVAGTETRVLNATVSPAEYERLANGTLAGISTAADDVGVENASFRFWVATDTHRLVRSTAELNLTVSVGPRNVAMNQTLTVDYRDYGGAVNVTLPADARKNPVNVSAGET